MTGLFWKMRGLLRWAGLSAAMAMGLLANAQAQDQENAIMRINFAPWGMHAQYFAGVAQGIYKKEGINLTIRPPSAGQQNEVFIGSGREQFGVTNVDSFVKARASGLKIKAIMMDQPNSPVSVIALASSGIKEPSSIKGKRLGQFPSWADTLVEPYLRKGGLTQKDITIVSVTRGAEVQLLAAGEVDAILGYSFGQALTLEQRGFPVNTMPLTDYGLVSYGTVIYTSEKLIEENPGLVQRFVKATVNSLLWTKDRKRDAVAEVIKVSPDRDLDLETRKLEIIYGLYGADDYAQTFGLMTEAKWNATIDFFASAGELKTRPKASEVFTNQFIESLPEAKALAKAVRN